MVIGLILSIALVFIVDKNFLADQVPRHTFWYGQNLSGLSESQAMDIVNVFTQNIETKNYIVQVHNTEFEVTPAQLGFSIDTEDAEEKIKNHISSFGCGKFLVCQFRTWIHSFFQKTELAQKDTFNSSQINEIFTKWEVDTKLPTPVSGSVVIKNGGVTAQYGAPGMKIDQIGSTSVLTETFLNPQSSRFIILPIQQVSVGISDSAVDEAVLKARNLISKSVAILDREDPLVHREVTGRMIANMIEVQSDEFQNQIFFSINPEKFAKILDPYMAKNASFDVSDQTNVTVVPSRLGIAVLSKKASDDFMLFLESGGEYFDISTYPKKNPSFLTADAEALHIKHLIAQYTTYYPCCADRVKNIHTMADMVNGATIRPGQRFSLNDYIGERTEDRGFLSAPTIMKSEITDTVGGGVSQFATTLFNAASWSGIEKIVSQTHSFYFLRYPEGVEATLSWPEPNLIITNDYSTGLLIRTRYTNTSITVSIYGDNNGRIFVGSWKNGVPDHRIITLGDTDARAVSIMIGKRYNPHPEPQTIYRADVTVPRSTKIKVQEGGDGWSLPVTRTVVSPTLTFEKTRTVVYQPHPFIYRVNPCDMPNVLDTFACGPD